MTKVELMVAFCWKHVGPVLLGDGEMLRFPKTSAQPGLYKFEITSNEGLTVYIGETSQISRRLTALWGSDDWTFRWTRSCYATNGGGS